MVHTHCSGLSKRLFDACPLPHAFQRATVNCDDQVCVKCHGWVRMDLASWYMAGVEHGRQRAEIDFKRFLGEQDEPESECDYSEVVKVEDGEHGDGH